MLYFVTELSNVAQQKTIDLLILHTLSCFGWKLSNIGSLASLASLLQIRMKPYPAYDCPLVCWPKMTECCFSVIHGYEFSGMVFLLEWIPTLPIVEEFMKWNVFLFPSQKLHPRNSVDPFWTGPSLVEENLKCFDFHILAEMNSLTVSDVLAMAKNEIHNKLFGAARVWVMQNNILLVCIWKKQQICIKDMWIKHP